MVYYFVQRGETLFTIAMRYQTTVHAIVTANRLEDPNGISPGQALIIPRPGEVPVPAPGGILHLVRAGETVFQLAARFKVTPQEILRANQVAHPEFILPGQQVVIPERMEAGDEWPTWGRTPGRTGISPVPVRGRPVQGWGFAPRRLGSCLPSAPVVRYGRVYVGLGDGQFYALDRGTGRVKWRLPAGLKREPPGEEETALATPLVFDGLVYLCGPDGVITAAEAHTGNVIWRVATGGRYTGSPGIWNGIIYTGSWDQHLYALEAKTGTVIWQQKLDGPVVGPVCTGDGRVFAVTQAGQLWALAAETGEAQWHVPADPSRHPVYGEVLVLVGGRAYDPHDGGLIWQVEAGGATPVVWLDQVIFPGGVVDLFTGIPKSPKPFTRQASPPVGEAPASQAETSAPGDKGPADGAAPEDHPSGGRAPIAGGQGPESGADASPGRAQPVPAVEPAMDRFISAGGLLLGPTADGRLCAREVGSGRLLWALGLDADIPHPPAVVGGQLLLTLGDGSLRTFRVSS